MARRSRLVLPNREPLSLVFGDSSTPLRIRIIRAEDGAYLFVRNGADPDEAANSDDDDTIMIPEISGEVQVIDPAGTGPWDLRLVADGGAMIVQFTDDS